MDPATRKYISGLAQRVINAYDIESPISDMRNVVRKLGGAIEEKDNFNDFFDGSIRKDGEYGFVIIISPFQNNQRKAFATAHEVGHLFLHMGFLTDRECWGNQSPAIYRRFKTAEQEYQANEFAASLFMPEDEFQRIFNEYLDGPYVDMRKVASYFNVSVSAAVSRGRSLGYLV